MRDSRLDKLADVLVNYSCRVKKGEKILIEAKNADYAIVSAIVEQVYKAGGLPFVQVYENRVTRALNLGMTEELAKKMAKFDSYRMKQMDAYIGIREEIMLLSFPMFQPTKCIYLISFIIILFTMG